MSEGFFVTGVELLTQPPVIKQEPNSKSRVEEKAQAPPVLKGFTTKKTLRSATAATKSAQRIKTDQLPNVQTAKETTAKQNIFRATLSETSLKKPLFKKLAGIMELMEKNRASQEGERMKDLKSAGGLGSSRKEHDRKNFTYADAFDQKITQKYDDMYRSQKGFSDTSLRESVARRKHLFNEIEKQETKVNGEQKRFNDIAYKIAQSEKLLQRLIAQNNDLGAKTDDTANLEDKYRMTEEKLRQWEEKIELEEHNKNCLQHMKQAKQELLFSLKKQYVKLKTEYNADLDKIGHLNKETEYTKTLYGKAVYNVRDLRNKKKANDNLIDPEFEELLQNEISEFEERRNLKEIMKHERMIEEEFQLQKEDQKRLLAQQHENKIRDEEYKRFQKEAEQSKVLNAIKNQYYEFQKVTHVSDKEDLIEYYDGLEERKEFLETEINRANDAIKARQEELNNLKKGLKSRKFEESEGVKEVALQDNRLDELEAVLREKLNEVTERQNHINRVEKTSYEVCTLVSRILKQLQRTSTATPVDKNNVADCLSICGLKLERMLTVILKTRKTFFVESINSDGTIQEGPPAYMNLVSDDVYNKSRKRFGKEALGDINEEGDDSELLEKREQIKQS